jgi:hypothetical protein
VPPRANEEGEREKERGIFIDRTEKREHDYNERDDNDHDNEEKRRGNAEQHFWAVRTQRVWVTNDGCEEREMREMRAQARTHDTHGPRERPTDDDDASSRSSRSTCINASFARSTSRHRRRGRPPVHPSIFRWFVCSLAVRWFCPSSLVIDLLSRFCACRVLFPSIFFLLLFRYHRHHRLVSVHSFLLRLLFVLLFVSFLDGWMDERADGLGVGASKSDERGIRWRPAERERTRVESRES